MIRRLRIKNSMTQQPTSECYVIIYGVDTLKMSGWHSNEDYIDTCHDIGKETLVYRR